MRISTKGRYAIQMMIDLAEHQNCGYIALKDISNRQNISKKYLEQIIPIFSRSNILKTIRGSQGGYKLARSPEKCTVGEILRLTEGSLLPIDEDFQGVPNGESYMLPIWRGLSDVINEYLDSITLRDIIDKKNEHYTNDYVI